MRNWIVAFTLVFLAALSPALRADNITYYVDSGVGSDGWIAGSIVTDGTTGVLSQANLVSDDLWLWPNVGPDAHITGSNQDMLLVGDDLTATSSDLMFNYTGTDGGIFYLSNSAAFACFASSEVTCLDVPPDAIGLSTDGGNSVTTTAGWNGNAVIGKNLGASDPAPTPEPGSLLLLGTGLLGMAGLGWRRIAA
jgi:hypothetical protein